MATTVQSQRKTATAEIPPLIQGERLTRAEFFRRSDAMPEVAHAERIEGIVYMQAAIRFVQHGRPQRRLSLWLGTYEVHTPGVDGGDNTTTMLDQDNDPAPDAILRILPECGGQSIETDEGYIRGTPELIGEISASTPHDLGAKLNVYRRNGVLEYIVWKTETAEILWFRLRDGEFVPLAPDEAGIFRSEVFPGLWLDAKAMLASDMPRVLEVLQQGLATPEHAAFVQRLQERASTNRQ